MRLRNSEINEIMEEFNYDLESICQELSDVRDEKEVLEYNVEKLDNELEELKEQ